MHLLIPFACCSLPECEPALRALQLPHLEKLLGRLALAHADTDNATSLTPPHERALARALGMSAPDGCVAWAAHQVARSGRDPGDQAWAWITPVHWDVGSNHIDMADPRKLDLQEPESRDLLASMQPFFVEDGITLEFAAAPRWLASGDVFGALPSASLDRVAGREIGAWMPSTPSLRRLQNEMQMLLYTHPVNDARGAKGLATVNSFWVSGTGRLPKSALTQAPSDLLPVDDLRAAAVHKDWEAWARSWAETDRGEVKQALELLDAGTDVRLTLCGDRAALTFAKTRGGFVATLRRRFSRITLHALRDQL